jgi:hypothetical protein
MFKTLQVFVRVRPLLGREIIEKVKNCVSILTEKQLSINDKYFSFDKIFTTKSTQVYLKIVNYFYLV